jgi:hypothetical protein
MLFKDVETRVDWRVKMLLSLSYAKPDNNQLDGCVCVCVCKPAKKHLMFETLRFGFVPT